MSATTPPPPPPPAPHLPLSRINTIMKSSSDAEKITKESTILMARATELFIKKLALEAHRIRVKDGQNLGSAALKRFSYKHVAEVVNTQDRYEFLRDIIPRKVTVAEYKKMMAAKTKPQQEDRIPTIDLDDDDDEDDNSDDDDDDDDERDENETSSTDSVESDDDQDMIT